MLRHAVILAVIALLAGATTMLIGQFRKKGWGSFDAWCDAEGMPLFIMISIAFGFAFLALKRLISN